MNELEFPATQTTSVFGPNQGDDGPKNPRTCRQNPATAKGADTKIELGFSMTLAGAIPGIHPEGRRLGALRLGSRLETPKSQVWFLPITGEAVIGDGFYDILCAPHAASGKYQLMASYDAVRRHQNSGLRQKNSAPRLRFVASSAFLGTLHAVASGAQRRGSVHYPS